MRKINGKKCIVCNGDLETVDFSKKVKVCKACGTYYEMVGD